MPPPKHCGTDQIRNPTTLCTRRLATACSALAATKVGDFVFGCVRIRRGRRGDHEHHGARLARHALAVLPRAGGSEAARALDEIAERQNAANEKRKEDAERQEQGAVASQLVAVVQ